VGQVTGAQLLVRALQREGVDRIFSLCGDHLNAIYMACAEAGVRIVDVRHESAAVHMADAHARVTGRPAVSMVTGGPGHTNSITGIATAAHAGSPVIAISGGADQSGADRNSFQEMDQVGIVRPLVKWARHVHEAARVPDYVATAFREAMAGRPGPVHLTVPVDVALARAEEAAVPMPPPVAYRPQRGPQGDPELVRRAVAMLREARQPAIIAGGGVRWMPDTDALMRFVDASGIPCFTLSLGRGVIGDDHPLCFGYPDPVLNGTGRVLSLADLVLVVGKRIDFRLAFGGPRLFAPIARVIQVDVDATELGRNRALAAAIHGEAGAVLAQMTAELERGGPWKDGGWLAEVRRAQAAARAALEPGENSGEVPIHPLRLCREIREVLTPETILAIDGGNWQQWARAALPARGAGRWLRLGNLGTVGAALPFAVAAKLARPESPVICVMGDGGMGFYNWELHTAVRHGAPIVVVVGNDQGWGMERDIQAGIYGSEKVIGCELGLVRYDKVAEAMGAHGEFVEKPAEIAPALRRALEAGRPALVNVMIRDVPSGFAEASIARYKR
jgi:acetolactate synthase-1/2/3 large subunit